MSTRDLANETKVDFVQFEVRNLSDRLTDVVRDFILSGEIAPDVPIRQDALAARLRVSKIPLREALARLEQDGLVFSHPNRGFFVTPLSAEEAEEVYALRLKLEPDAAAFACTKATEVEQSAAHDALTLLARDAAAHKPTVGALNRNFHIALVRPGGRMITTRMVTRLHVIADRYVRKHLEPLGRHIRAEAEHEEILAAWLSRRSDQVQKLVRQHLVHTLEDLRRQLGAAPEPAPKRSRARK
jgi:DNA-binding GntR family transcriptional regulator